MTIYEPNTIVTHDTLATTDTNQLGSCSGFGVNTSNSISYGTITQTCVTCGATVDTADMAVHLIWHEQVEQRLNLLESLLRDVLVNKVDIDKLLDL